MALTPLPTPPSRDDPANFAARGDAFLGALPTFASELNAELPTINEAIPASEIAVALVNYKGDYSASTTYLVGQSVTYNDVRFLSKKTNLNITPVDGADWYELAAGAETVVRSILNQSSAITLLASDGGGYLLVSGTTEINLNLPNATTLIGRTFVIKNIGNFPMFVQNSAGTFLFVLNGNESCAIWASDISTSAGEWTIQDLTAPYGSNFLNFGPTTGTGASSLQPIARLSSSKVIVFFNQTVDVSNKIYGVVVTNTGGTITFGSPQLITSIDGTGTAAVGLSSTSAIVSWRTTNGSAWMACALSLSGDTITAGTPITIASSISDKIKFSFLTSTTAVIAGYTTTSQLSAGVCTVSGTTLTCGTLVDIGTPQVVNSLVGYGLCSLSATLCLSHAAGGGGNNGHARTLTISGTTITANATVSSAIASGNPFSSLSAQSATSATLAYYDSGNLNFCLRRITVSGTTPTFQTPQTVVSNAYFSGNGIQQCYVMHKDANSGYAYGQVASTDGDRIWGFTLSANTYTIGSAISPSSGSSTNTAWRALENFSVPTVGGESTTYTAYFTPLQQVNIQSLSLSGTTASASTRVGVANRLLGAVESPSGITSISANRAIVLTAKQTNAVTISLFANLVDYSTATPTLVSTILLSSSFASTGGYSSVSLSATQCLLSYTTGANNDLYSVILTITGDTLALGTEVLVTSGNAAGANMYHSLAKLTATSVFLTFSLNNTILARAVVLSISGTTITVGTAVSFTATSSQGRSDCIALDSTNVVVAYYTNSDYIAYCTVSGSTITIVQNFRSNIGDTRVKLTSLSSTKFILSGGDSTSGGYMYARVGELSSGSINLYAMGRYPTRYGAWQFIATSSNRGIAYDDQSNVAMNFTVDASNVIRIGKTANIYTPYNASLLQTNAVSPNGYEIATLGYTNQVYTNQIYGSGAIK
jgi:hypothetical protein